jgi:bacillithiol system protein YtxJ
MTPWLPLESEKQLDAIVERSNSVPCLLFKHSTRCEISSMAKHRLESKWDLDKADVEPYFLDLIQFRSISAAIADRFGVHHESPQVLLISNGECVYDASHLDISVKELRESLLDVA